MGFTKFYWVLLDFTGFLWVLRGFTGFYWVLSEFYEFYWSLLDSSDSIGAKEDDDSPEMAACKTRRRRPAFLMTQRTPSAAPATSPAESDQVFYWVLLVFTGLH